MQRIAVVTGANKGIGYEIAKQLLTTCTVVVLACRNRELGEAAVKQLASPKARFMHGAELADNKLFIFGGSDGNKSLSDVSVLAALGLRKAESALMPSAKAVVDDYACVVGVVAGCVLSQDAGEHVYTHACEVAKRARSKSEMASLSAALTVLRGSQAALPFPAFVLGHADDSDVVSCNRMGFNGAFETATMGTLVDAPKRAVLLLHIGPKGVRVTSTKGA